MMCKAFRTFCYGIAVFSLTTVGFAQEGPPAKAIQDNSFLVEEAYNQEAGVVQHILTAQYAEGGGARAWQLSFTQEWPVFSQLHQFSYTVPYNFVRSDGPWRNGVGDVLLNYRFQALFETDRIPAFAPRLSLILPTGDAATSLGSDTLGWQVNLPFSKVVGERWTVHANAGATLLPDVHGNDLWSYNLDGSAIYAVTRDLNLMLECVANFFEEPTARHGTSRSTSVVLSPGFRYGWNFPRLNDAQMVVGVAAPIGVTHDAPNYGVFLYFSFEHALTRTAGKPSPK